VAYPVVAGKVEGIANFMDGKVACELSHKDILVVPPCSPEFLHVSLLVCGSMQDDVLGGLHKLEGITEFWRSP
jgi:hypothetical protein